jgi:lycopene cyclase domain-containing protein
MLPDKYTYLALMLGSLAYPLLQSFEKRVYMWKRMREMLPAILITAFFFTIWDVYFTIERVWWFSDTHTLPYRFIYMPLEEWSFFLVIPYCCFFVYFVVNYFIPSDPLKKYQHTIARILGGLLLIVGIVFFDRIYTSIATLGSGALLLFLSYRVKVDYLGRFFLGFLFSTIPFIFVNGQLTEIPVVMYDNTENTGVRIVIDGISNIPVEDLAYNLLMLLMNVSIYEYLVERKARLKG